MRTLGFCPFCREPFEHRETCPDHGLRLVDFTALPPATEHADAGPLPLGLTHGRGYLLLGALLTLVAFALPLAHLTGQVEATNTLWDVATHRGKTLWAAAAAPLALLVLLGRRRSPARLRGARVVAGLLALAPSLVVAWSARGVLQAAAALSVRVGGVDARLGLGFWLVLLAALPGLWGAFQLGRTRHRAYRVHVVD